MEKLYILFHRKIVIFKIKYTWTNEGFLHVFNYNAKKTNILTTKFDPSFSSDSILNPTAGLKDYIFFQVNFWSPKNSLLKIW